MHPERSHPTHDLAEVQKRVAVGFVTYRAEALRGALRMGYTRHDIDTCIATLTIADFYKSMPSHNPKWQDCWQDVYKPMFEGRELYVKLQLFPAPRVYVVSFKDRYDDAS